MKANVNVNVNVNVYVSTKQAQTIIAFGVGGDCLIAFAFAGAPHGSAKDKVMSQFLVQGGLLKEYDNVFSKFFTHQCDGCLQKKKV